MRALRGLVVGAAVVASVFGARIGVTEARFTDAESVASNRFTTLSIATPAGLTGTAKCVVAVRSNELSWNASSNASSYTVERALGADGTFLPLVTVLTTTYTDLDLLGGTYRYRVIAKRELWTSSPSSSITMTQPTLCV